MFKTTQKILFLCVISATFAFACDDSSDEKHEDHAAHVCKHFKDTSSPLTATKTADDAGLIAKGHTLYKVSVEAPEAGAKSHTRYLKIQVTEAGEYKLAFDTTGLSVELKHGENAITIEKHATNAHCKDVDEFTFDVTSVGTLSVKVTSPTDAYQVVMEHGKHDHEHEENKMRSI